MSTIPTPPSTTLSEPSSPTELPVRLSDNDRDVEDLDSDPTMLGHHPSHSAAATAQQIIKTTTTTIRPVTVHPKPIYVIVATSLNPPMGIGNKGGLPWPPIKADMAFFRKVTSYVPPTTSSSDPDSSLLNLNAVIMGRKTWESIPPKFRPLPNRLNVIITRSNPRQLGQQIAEAQNQNQKAEPDVVDWRVGKVDVPATKTNIPSTTSKPNTNDATESESESEATPTIVVPLSSSSSSPSSTQSPIMISQDLKSALAILSSTSPISVSVPKNSKTASASASASSQEPKYISISISIPKIFCIGGAEIYRQILSLSSTTPSTTGPETELYDVRILQTQVRKATDSTAGSVSSTTTDNTSTAASSAAAAARRPSSTIIEPPKKDDFFECDTFFPDALPADPAIKSAKWKVVAPERLNQWVGEGVEIPQFQNQNQIQIEAGGNDNSNKNKNKNDSDRDRDQQQKEQKEGCADDDVDDDYERYRKGSISARVLDDKNWYRDGKTAIEIRVVGWERR
ncbi:hypothetical protein HRR83_006464 [Exophiala dermatitidis]|uniref:Dihydrofolate reductase n=2 Tax=Exophiala dermatitidis TaxID=5970 RepID=H6CAE0_EXODN|nr:dihydrofolate reductase [Exophiala dermatitidis NIH/UT8656]KAJ4504565.1 hypothetical protein HRR73_008739 [Exophiala dermatitidis]EHY60104.1 dihydrofolate reductase [Exophiala dermatitidis NIH/UT8656]KAJ4505350.1 hypothetical protein HRR74_008721 [Exophiala dermatitidis]KAJ4530664.1 hypothetical protein HRR76_008362 [Exophiala dermatitidis]KAJ4545168.1 hypothetical protein HRR77_005027 [Exophiala dermatitidis]